MQGIRLLSLDLFQQLVEYGVGCIPGSNSFAQRLDRRVSTVIAFIGFDPFAPLRKELLSFLTASDCFQPLREGEAGQFQRVLASLRDQPRSSVDLERP